MSSLSFVSHFQVISEIVSIDIGFQNAAWVRVDKDKQVLGWSRAEILKPKPYNPAVFRPLVSSHVDCFAVLSVSYLDVLSNEQVYSLNSHFFHFFLNHPCLPVCWKF